MPETIDKDEYDDEVESQGDMLASAGAQEVATFHTTDGEAGYEDYHTAVLDLSSDVLDAHEWFARSHYGPAACGCIIEHAQDADVDVERFNDWYSMAESDDIRTTLKRIAYFAFESAVIEYALDQDPDDY